MELNKIVFLISWRIIQWLSIICGIFLIILGIFGIANKTAYYGRLEFYLPHTERAAFFLNLSYIIIGLIIFIPSALAYKSKGKTIR